MPRTRSVDGVRGQNQPSAHNKATPSSVADFLAAHPELVRIMRKALSPFYTPLSVEEGRILGAWVMECWS